MKHIRKHKKLIVIGSIALLGYIAFWIVLFYAILPLPQEEKLTADSRKTDFIAQRSLTGKTTVESKAIAQKLNLQRKIIQPSSPQKVTEITNAIKKHGGEIVKTTPSMIVARIPKETESVLQEELTKTSSITALEVDHPTFLTADNPDWGVQRIQAPDVWETTKADGIKIAVVDTGMDYTHKDLQGRYAGGYDTLNEDSDPFDDHGHGTHVAGIIATALDGSGLAGVAPGGQILAVKALGADGTGYISDVVEAVEYAIRSSAHIMNFSLGTTYDSKTLESTLNEAASKGIILVAAAGNTNGGALLYPAAYGSVISVAATDSNDNFASFSSLGAEIAAPGVSVTSTVPGNGYATWSGTSMAAPHIAATAALMLANSQTNIRDNLQKTAIDLGPAGVDGYYGYGLVHAKPAALGEDVLSPVVTFLEPGNNSTVNGAVTVQLAVQDESLVKAVKLLVNNQQVQEWSQEPYSYTWDTSGLSGTYELVVHATDEYDNTGEAKITLTVSKDPVTPTPTTFLHQMQQQGQSQSVRQDIYQEQAAQHRQNYQNTPDSPQQAAQKGEEKRAEQSPQVPEVSNINERNQKPENPGNSAAAGNAGKRDVKGTTTMSFWQAVKEQVISLFVK